MNQGIPKSARDLLARQIAADAHPSPDLLNGYVEQSLTAAEKSLVTNHLTSCSDCRDIVFLASTAAEQESQLAEAAAVQQEHRTASAEAQLRNPWRWWAIPVLAAIAIGAGVLLERDRIVQMFHPATTQTAAVDRQQERQGAPGDSQALEYNNSSTHVVLSPLPGSPPKPAMSKSSGKQIRAARPNEVPQENLSLAKNEAASQIANSDSRAAGTQKAVTPKASQPVEVTSAAPLVQADNADLSTNFSAQPTADSLKSGFAGASPAGAISTSELPSALRQAMNRPSQWRISQDGHLEHAIGPNSWKHVLASEPVRFRVVSTIGGNIWAGGNGGALFHSSDGGEHWNKVALGADNQAERGAIISINFNTAQQGSVASDSGATWTTADGGQTWSKQ